MNENDEIVLFEIKSFLSDGKFERAIEKIKKTRSKFKKNDLNNILVFCCEACTNSNIKSKIKSDKIVDLLQLILLDISKLDDVKSADVYIRTLYFVLQLFIEKKDSQNILQLRQFFCVKLLELPCKEIEKVYKGLMSKLHNYLVSDYANESKDINTLISLSELIILLLLPIESVSAILKKYVYYYVRLYHNADPSLHNYINMDKNLFKVALSKVVRCDEEVLVSVLQLISNILQAIPTLCTQSLLHVINIVLGELSRLPKDTEYENAVKVLQTIAILLGDFNSYPDEKQLCDVLNECVLYIKKLSTHKNDVLTNVLEFISNVLKNLASSYKTIALSLWQKKFTRRIENSFIILLNTLESITEKCAFKCSSSDCKKDHGIFALYNFNVFKMNMLKKTEITDERILKCASKVLHLIDNYKTCCEYWTQYWKQFAVIIYNLSAESIKTCVCEQYLIFSLTALLKFYNDKELVKDSLLANILLLLCKYYKEMKDLENTLTYSAIGVLLRPNNIDTFSNYWMQTKYGASNSIQERTFVDVINKCDSPLKNMLPSLSVTDVKKLLHTELTLYKELWPSKVSMISVCKQLEMYEDLSTFSKTLAKNWIDSIPYQNKDLYYLVINTLKKLSDNSELNGNVEVQLYESLLKYISFKYALNQTSDEIKNEIELKKDLLERNNSDQNEVEFEERRIFCSYDCLKLKNHFKIMNCLLEFLTFMDTFLKSDHHIDMIDFLKEVNICKILINAAFDFRLQNYTIEMLQCWSICLKLSELINDQLNILTCISFLLESSNTETCDTNRMMMQAEEIIRELNDTPENLYATITYYLNVTYHYLIVNQLDKAKDNFHVAKELFIKSNNRMLMSRIKYLFAKFFMLPCGIYNFKHDYECVTGLYIKFLSNSNEYRKGAKVLHYETSYINCLIMEKITELCSLYSFLKLPRELHCYAKLIVYCAMEQVVPLRVSYILCYLIDADLLCVNLDTWRCKLNDIDNVLCLDERTEIDVNVETRNVATLCDDMQHLLIDCSNTTRQYQTSYSSPKLHKSGIKLPNCLEHPLDCTCFFCINLEYQEIALMKLNSEAALSIYQGENDIANKYFNIILRLYDMFAARKSVWEEKVNVRIPINIIKYPETKLDLIYCKTLADYRDNHIRSNSLNEASILNNKLITLLENIKHSEMYTNNDANFYKLVFNLKPIIQIIPEDEDGGISEEPRVMDDVKTPENKVSTIVINEPPSNIDVTPMRKAVKVLKFDLGNDTSPINSKSNYLIECDTNKKKSSKKNNNRLEVYEDVDYIPASPKSEKCTRILKTATSLLATKTIASVKKGKEKENEFQSIRKNLFTETNEESTNGTKKRTVKSKKTSNNASKGNVENEEQPLRRSRRNHRL